MMTHTNMQKPDLQRQTILQFCRGARLSIIKYVGLKGQTM